MGNTAEAILTAGICADKRAPRIASLLRKKFSIETFSVLMNKDAHDLNIPPCFGSDVKRREIDGTTADITPDTEMKEPFNLFDTMLIYTNRHMNLLGNPTPSGQNPVMARRIFPTTRVAQFRTLESLRSRMNLARLWIRFFDGKLKPYEKKEDKYPPMLEYQSMRKIRTIILPANLCNTDLTGPIFNYIQTMGMPTIDKVNIITDANCGVHENINLLSRKRFEKKQCRIDTEGHFTPPLPDIGDAIYLFHTDDVAENAAQLYGAEYQERLREPITFRWSLPRVAVKTAEELKKNVAWSRFAKESATIDPEQILDQVGALTFDDPSEESQQPSTKEH